jgi:biotin transport system ATP-binding protein
MIRLERVSHAFDSRIVLTDLSLELTERRIGVIGANGSGKSTFARLLNGLIVPKKGRVWVDGLDTASDGRKVRGRVGFVFQNPDTQIVMPTVAEDIAFGLKPLKLPAADEAARVAAALDAFGLGTEAERPAHLLSGGQKQLLALAAVMVMRPSWIIFDEPTTLLDLRNKARVTHAMAALDVSIVHVTHDLDQLDGYDRVLVFHDGRLAADAPPVEAIARYRALMA